LNITITHSDPNSDVAYKELQRFQFKIIFQLKNVLGKRDLHRSQLKGMVLGNRNMSPRSGSEFKLP